jgi:hypothetical protein
MSVIRAIIASEIIEISWITCKNTLIIYDFHSSCTYFYKKNNSRFAIFIKNLTYRHVICIFLTKRNFSKKFQEYPFEGCPRQKISKDFLNWNISIYISVDAVFDADYESAIIFCEIFYIKNENRKLWGWRNHFATPCTMHV